MSKRKVFLSYNKADKGAVDDFCEQFGKTFIRRGMKMEDDLINSTDTDYVMAQIRKRYLKDSTVTIVLIGKCTWSRRFVDWEIQSSLRRSEFGPPPNGLIGIQLWKSYKILPRRLSRNVDTDYSRFYEYPSSQVALWRVIEWAYNQRSKNNLIVNPRERFSYNRACK